VNEIYTQTSISFLANWLIKTIIFSTICFYSTTKLLAFN